MKPVVVTLTVVLLLGALSLQAQKGPLSRASVLDSLVKLSEIQNADYSGKSDPPIPVIV